MLNYLADNPWLVSYKANPKARIRLFCFPHGGSGPQLFRDWHKELSETIDLYVIQPPGRGNRLKEFPYTQMKPLVNAIVKEILPYMDKPFAFLGHSLGGLICFEVTRELRRQCRHSPIHLFIVSCRAPQLPASGTPSYNLPDKEFIEKMRRGNSTPVKILTNPKLMNLFLPSIRADAVLGDTYQYCIEEPLDCPISAFGGTEDTVVSQNELNDWRYQTHNSFKLQMFEGDHFFLKNDSASFLRVLREQLDQCVDENASNLEGVEDLLSIENWLKSRVSNKLAIEIEHIDKNKSFFTYGLDSVTAVSLVEDIKKSLKSEISPTIIWNYPNIKSLAKYLFNQKSTSEKFSNNIPTKKQQLIDILPEYYNFSLNQNYLNLKKEIHKLEAIEGGGNPYFKVNENISNNNTVIDGKELINYSSYNYLGLSGDAKVNSFVKESIDLYGTSVSASRIISGEKPIHRQLEREIADIIGVSESIVFVGGHATNVTTISHLFGEKDLILCDSLSHNSISEGCSFSGAKILPFAHNNWQALDNLLATHRHNFQQVLIVIEGIYSADGDIPDLPKFIEVKKRHKVFLMIDEAHSIGVLGKQGCGIGEYYGINPNDVDIWMGTLSKSFASCGGYIAGSSALIEYLKYTAPGFIYSVGMSPANTAAALAAIQVLKAQPERVVKLHARAKLFLELAQKYQLNTGFSQNTPIIPIIIGNSLKCIKLSQALFRRGINVQPMIYPSVPENMARLRFFITSKHTEEQIKLTVDATFKELEKL
ncbi:MAG: aminotransferase class I/II-fold pyridoxal phosphate-dependent enzyme [Mastigocoleus sp.]